MDWLKSVSCLSFPSLGSWALEHLSAPTELQRAQSLRLDKACVPAPEGEVFLRLRNLGCRSI